MIDINTNTEEALGRLGEALGKVEGIGRRSGAELIRRAAADIILGSKGSGNGAGSFPGLSAAFWDVAPREGEPTAEAEGRGWTVGTDSTSYRRGLSAAKSVLGSEPSAIFHVQRGTRGRVFTPKRVYVRTRGKSKGQSFVQTGRRRLPKTAQALDRTALSPEDLRQRGYARLNLQALAVAYAIAYREAARGSTAAQFLVKRYRRELLRKAGFDYTRGGMARGVGSVELAQTHEHRRVLVPNRSGTPIGRLDMTLSQDGQSSAHIMGLLGAPDRHRGILAKVVTAVAIDRETYLINRAIRETIRKR